MRKRLFWFFIVFGIFPCFFIMCKKAAPQNAALVGNAGTSVLVDAYVYSNTPEFFPLNVVGGSIYKAVGIKGIIIYRVSNSGGNGDFVAFERSCSYDGANKTNALVKIQSDKVSAKDSSCCGSKYSIIDGSVINGPSTYPLRAYHTTFDGNALHITN
jgi:Rieske Fe-S protein